MADWAPITQYFELPLAKSPLKNVDLPPPIPKRQSLWSKVVNLFNGVTDRVGSWNPTVSSLFFLARVVFCLGAMVAIASLFSQLDSIWFHTGIRLIEIGVLVEICGIVRQASSCTLNKPCDLATDTVSTQSTSEGNYTSDE